MPFPIKSSILFGEKTRISMNGTSGLFGSIRFENNEWSLSDDNGVTWRVINDAADVTFNSTSGINLSSNLQSAVNQLSDEVLKTSAKGNIKTITALTATNAALPTNTISADNQIITGTANGAIPSSTTGLVTLTVGSILLVRFDTVKNGYYVVTQVGSVSAPFILTRHPSFTTGDSIIASSCRVTRGNNSAGVTFENTQASIVLGTTSISFVNGAISKFDSNDFTSSSTTNIVTIQRSSRTAGNANTTLATNDRVLKVSPGTNLTRTVSINNGFSGDFTIYNDSTTNGKIAFNSDIYTLIGTKSINDLILNPKESIDIRIENGLYIILKSITLNASTSGIAVDNGLTINNNIVELGGTLNKDTLIDVKLNTLSFQSLIKGFESGTGFDNSVRTSAIQSDGKIIIVGDFSSYDGITANKIIRLNVDGSIDTSFNTGTGFPFIGIYSVAIQPDEKILVGGFFSSYNGTTSNNIIRLNTDGSIDTSFVIGTGFDGGVTCLLVQSDDKILIGGQFTTYDGTASNKIIRLNTDGSIDTSFVIGTGFVDDVYSLAIQNDSKIIIGGNFTSYDGTSLNSIIRLETDGSVDTSFIVGTGFNNVVQTIAIQLDEKILVGGYFSDYNGSTNNRIVRLNTDGSKDTSFVIDGGFNTAVNLIVVQPDEKILVGGIFTTYKTIFYTSNKIIRLNIDGSVDTSFNIGTGFGGGGGVNTILIQDDEKIIVGGDCTTYNGITANRIIRLNVDGTINNDTDAILNYNSDLLNYNDNYHNFYTDRTLVDKEYVDLSISNNNLDADNGLTNNDNVFELGGTLNKDTDINVADNSFALKTIIEGFDTGTGFNDVTYVSAIQSDEKILVGGYFTEYNGNTYNRIIRLNTDGTVDTSFVIGTGFDALGVYCITILSDGKILVGGEFTEYDGNSSLNIVRLNSDGSIDSSFDVGTGFTGTIKQIAIQPDGKYVIVGEFTNYNGNDYNRIIRLETDGSIDTSFVIGDGFNNATFSIFIQSDDKLLVGGHFTEYDGNVYNKIIRLNTDGSIDTSFVIGTGFDSAVLDIAIQADDKIIVGGYFTFYDSNPYNYLIRLETDGSIDSSFVIGTGFNGVLYKVNIQPDGKILVGGNFISYDGYGYKNLARLNDDGSIDTTFESGDKIDSDVLSITLDASNNIFLTGFFTSYNMFPCAFLIKLDENGALENKREIKVSFDSTGLLNYNSDYHNSYTYRTLVDKEYVDNSLANSIQYYDANNGLTNTNNLFELGGLLTKDTEIDANINDLSIIAQRTGFNIGTGFSSTVNYIAIQSDDKILVGGAFASVNGTTANKIIRLNNDGSIDTSFVTGLGFNSTGLGNLAIQSDGKIVVIGGFTSYNGVTSNRIIRLNPDGSKDTSFVIGTGFNTTASTIAIQSDDKILVGGNFTTYNGTTSNRIIRLNTDGSIDTSFVIGSGFNAVVNSITIQFDDKILVGGSFITYKGVTSNRIIRLNPDGSKDTSFVIGTGFNVGVVQDIKFQNDDKLIICGTFNEYNNTPCNYLIRLEPDGSIDTSFVTGDETGDGFDSTVQSIAIQSDGKILVAGSFGTYRGFTSISVVRINTDGSVDTTFNVGVNFNNIARYVICDSSGKIFVGGSFTAYGIYPANRFAKLLSNGSIDTTLNLKLNYNGSALNYANNYHGYYTDRTLVDKEYVDLSITNYTSDNGLTNNSNTFELGGLLNRDTEIDVNNNIFSLKSAYKGLNLGTGFNNNIATIAIQSDNKILVGGAFTAYNGTSINYIIRLNTNGSIDTSFDVGTGFNSGGFVKSIAIQSDNKILVGGGFTTYNGTTANRIIRLNDDGSVDTSFVTGSGFNLTGVNTIRISPLEDKIYVGGNFTIYNGTIANYITSLNIDGSIDTSFVTGTGFNGVVNNIEYGTGGIIVGGVFTSYNGTSANYIIGLQTTGSIYTFFNIGTGFNTFVNKIQRQSDDKFIIVGGFTSYNSSTYNRIIRLNTNGSIDTSFNIGSGFNTTTFTTTLTNENKIIVGGQFTSYNGFTYNRIIRLNTNGSIDTSFDIGSGFDVLSVNTITIQSNYKLLAGGVFNSYNGTTSNYFTRLNDTGSIDIDIDYEVLFDETSLNYANDYSTYYTDRTLVDKGYVKNLVSSSQNSSVSVTVTALQYLISNNAITVNTKYIITNPQLGGTIVVDGVSSNNISDKATWLRPTNIPGFGWIRLTGGASGNISVISVNGVNQLTSTITYTTSLTNTVTLAVDNINANGSATYRAIAILDTIVLVKKTAGTSDNGFVVAATTTTITTGFVQNITGGINSTIQNLFVSYSAATDDITECYDPILNNRMSFRTGAADKTSLNNFRWGDPLYYDNTFESAIIKDNFIVAGNGGMIGNVVRAGCGITNNICAQHGGLYYNYVMSSNAVGFGINNNLMIGGSNAGSGPYIGRCYLTYTTTSTCIQNNIMSGINTSINNVTVEDSSFGLGIIGNVISGDNAKIRNIKVSNAILACTVNSNTLSGSSTLLLGLNFNAASCACNNNILSATSASIRNILFNIESCTLNGNTISSPTTNPSIRKIIFNGVSSTINNNVLSNLSIATGGMNDIKLNGSGSGINNLTTTSPGGVQNVVIDAPNGIITGYTFDTTLSIIQNINWKADNTISMNLQSATFTGATNLGLVGSPVNLGIVPIAKAYPTSITLEGNGLTSSTSGTALQLLTETDTSLIYTPSLTLSNANNINTVASFTSNKTTAANRRIQLIPSGGNITGGSVQVFVNLNISRY